MCILPQRHAQTIPPRCKIIAPATSVISGMPHGCDRGKQDARNLASGSCTANATLLRRSKQIRGNCVGIMCVESLSACTQACGRVRLQCARHVRKRRRRAWPGVLTYHVPGMYAGVRRTAWAGVLAMCHAMHAAVKMCLTESLGSACARTHFPWAGKKALA